MEQQLLTCIGKVTLTISQLIDDGKVVWYECLF
jgi:hypothetical protein